MMEKYNTKKKSKALYELVVSSGTHTHQKTNNEGPKKGYLGTKLLSLADILIRFSKHQ